METELVELYSYFVINAKSFANTDQIQNSRVLMVILTRFPFDTQPYLAKLLDLFVNIFTSESRSEG